jgi:leucyl-tRNA synthetase
VYYKNDIPHLVDDAHLPIELPEVDKYLPTEDGEPPLARAEKSAWKYSEGDRMETNTMPGWAGSSFYFLRYMDPRNTQEFVSKEKADYWNQVDLYIGGSEHATGHLLYSRFWAKFLFDKGFISFDEPFKKMINQGMILGRSSFVYLYHIAPKINGVLEEHKRDSLIDFLTSNKVAVSKNLHDSIDKIDLKTHLEKILDAGLIRPGNLFDHLETVTVDDIQLVFTQKRHIDIKYIDGDKLDIESASKDPIFDYLLQAEFIREDNGDFLCDFEVEKMSKSKFNVQTPDELVQKFGADTLRMYEMFLGPLEQTKPWDTKGISGVHNFLRKLWRLFYEDGNLIVTDTPAAKASLKTLHKTIKKVEDDLERYSFNTNVSNLMICVNELTDQKCHSKEVLEQVVVLLAPYAPHAAEELWSEALGYEAGTVSTAHFPTFDPEMLVEANTIYPVSFNGKMRFNAELPTTFSAKEVEEAVLAMPEAQKWLEGKAPKKVIVVPGKIVNMVV